MRTRFVLRRPAPVTVAPVGSAEPVASRPPDGLCFSQADGARLPTRCTTRSGLKIDVA
eukprot:CAMPEP_0194494362 /NCGR_PEP_ID=MMETSP0253-20130528/12292_1 /TAXON_ID=2966 /ORGANISM="Noctiluca scintillans" /LENGTH=57 /DNA_ID=CAMNT_0039335465 /DNA_START=20 /DNA_END=190 /DNA_ORIENTATION=+